MVKDYAASESSIYQFEKQFRPVMAEDTYHLSNDGPKGCHAEGDSEIERYKPMAKKCRQCGLVGSVAICRGVPPWAPVLIPSLPRRWAPTEGRPYKLR